MPNPNTLTETIGNKQIVYTYNDDEQIISSITKSIPNQHSVYTVDFIDKYIKSNDVLESSTLFIVFLLAELGHYIFFLTVYHISRKNAIKIFEKFRRISDIFVRPEVWWVLRI